jgi:hypothetical protein
MMIQRIGKSEGNSGGGESEQLGEGWLLIDTLLGVQQSLSSSSSRSDGSDSPKELRKTLTARELLQSPFFDMKP